MAVYKRTYSRYDGILTAEWSRFLVIPRFAFEEMHQSRFLTVFYLASFICPLIFALVIYLHHNLSALQLLRINPDALIKIDAGYFLNFLGIQSMGAFFLASFVGPGLVSPDLSNGALPLYLARPFTRAEYVLGKFSVLAILMSLMTWIPGLLLYGLQSYLDGWTWIQAYPRIPLALVAGAWIWILVLGLLALALSAWVKWKPAAGGLLFGTFFVAAGFGAVINGILRTRWGLLLNISNLMGSVWLSLFEKPVERGAGAVFFRVAQRAEGIPVWCCWAMLVALCGVCLLLLGRKIRGVEVAR